MILGDAERCDAMEIQRSRRRRLLGGRDIERLSASTRIDDVGVLEYELGTARNISRVNYLVILTK